MSIVSGQILANRYEIIGKIGEGGMSDVYKALDKKLNRIIAIKVLKNEYAQDQTFVAKFRMEAQSAACLSNPNIVKVFDVGEEEGSHYIVMEFIEGITLKKYIDRRGKLGIREAIEVALQVAYGLEAAHSEHIVHRDIKPQNIMISKEGKVYVTDFGIARAVSGQTIKEKAMGSAHYISPEQAKGGHCDERSDIYSLGITMYEMLTGRVPFEGDSTVAVALLHIQGEMVPPSVYEPLIPVSLEKIILKCTQKDPEDRYLSATELIADLKKALTSPNEDFVNLESSAAAGIAAAGAKTVEGAESLGKTGTKEVPSDKVRKAIEAGAAKSAKEDFEDIDDIGEESDDETDESEARFEKLVTYIGIGVAAVVVIILLIVGVKACGLFDFGNGSKEESTETSIVEMIDITGKTYEEAELELGKLGLELKVTYVENTGFEEGKIYDQDIKQGTSVNTGTVINAKIAAASGGILVPDGLTGKTPEAVRSILRNAGFTNISDTLIQEASEVIDAGLVIRTEPASNTSASKDTLVTIIVSSGKTVATTTVPSLIDLEEGVARERLASYKLTVGTVSYEYSNNTEKGDVMLQATDPGTTVEEGTAISFTVSKGPKETQAATVQVPDLEGLSRDKAKSKLQSVGLYIGNTETEETDDKSMDGKVIGQTPSSGKTVEEGTYVDIVIGEYREPDTSSGDVSSDN